METTVTVNYVDPVAAPARSWSIYQEAVFTFVVDGTGHGVILARAGSGKTTTIIEACKRMGNVDVLFVCFNARIAEELQHRVPSNTKASTLHSHGFRAVKHAFRGILLDKARDLRIVKQVLPVDTKPALVGMLIKLVSMCKAWLATTIDEVLTLANAYQCLADRDDCEPEIWAQYALTTLDKAKAITKRGKLVDNSLSFDDMVWLPVVLGLSLPKYDRVLVDESQDLNRVQQELVLRSIVEDGRILAVGDDRQSIYAFAGADSTSMARMTERLNATTLPLSITYRCPRAVVRLANQYVPDLEAAEGAIEGVVNAEVEKNDMMVGVTEGDAILSRTNAPLVRTCLALLRAGKRATVVGRDVGEGLANLVKKSQTRSIGEFSKWLGNFQLRETERLLNADKEDQVEALEDRVNTLHALAEGCATTFELITRIENLFSDDKSASRILLSSTHKAKGLEWDRVWMLEDTYRPGQNIGEDNLCYVAITRAKKELNLVVGVK